MRHVFASFFGPFFLGSRFCKKKTFKSPSGKKIASAWRNRATQNTRRKRATQARDANARRKRATQTRDASAQRKRATQTRDANAQHKHATRIIFTKAKSFGDVYAGRLSPARRKPGRASAPQPTRASNLATRRRVARFKMTETIGDPSILNLATCYRK